MKFRIAGIARQHPENQARFIFLEPGTYPREASNLEDVFALMKGLEAHEVNLEVPGYEITVHPAPE